MNIACGYTIVGILHKEHGQTITMAVLIDKLRVERKLKLIALVERSVGINAERDMVEALLWREHIGQFAIPDISCVAIGRKGGTGNAAFGRAMCNGIIAQSF